MSFVGVCCPVGSLCLTIWMAGWTGTDVKRGLHIKRGDDVSCFQLFAL